MEAAAARGGSLPVPPSQPHRKEWRAVSDHAFQSNGTEETEHVQLGQSDERTAYEKCGELREGSEPLDVDFCSITIDGGGGLSDDILQRRIHDVSRRREELQLVEIELQARVIARSEILEVQGGLESQLKEHTNLAARLKEQLQEREQCIHELELKLEEKDRELRAVKMDNEAAWTKEEATFRREHDNSETERAQHIQQIHDLQEHIQEKESQFLALEEQHRVAQETILYKDEQLREAQAWVARVQEMGTLQSTTNQSLQTELQERIEQFNQYCIGFQHQFADMERHHLQAIQQLQLELAEARERNGPYTEGSQGAHVNSTDLSSLGNKQNQINANDTGTLNGVSGFVPIGNLDGVPAFVSFSSASTKIDHVPGVPVIPSSIVGMGGFLPHGHMTLLNHYVVQPQVPQSVSSTSTVIPQSHVGHVQALPTIPALEHWQNQQAISDISQTTMENKSQPSETEENLLRSASHYQYEISVERQVVHADHVNSSISQQQRSGPVMNGVNEEVQVQDGNIVSAVNHSQEQPLMSGQQLSASDAALSSAQISSVTSSDATDRNGSNENTTSLAEVPASVSRTASSFIPGKVMEPTLLDERSLLACIVRAIPAGSGNGIRISTTLPNRLAKMLAPLHWHDYKKHYGKLDDFLAQHPELFVIEGDFIHLREGAQEIISATTAVAKVAAASSALYSSFLPSIAVTPIAQSGRPKKAASADPRRGNSIPFTGGSVITVSGDSSNKHSQTSKMYNQLPNGVSFNIVQGFSDIKNLSKSKDLQEPNGLSTGTRPANSSVHVSVGNGAKLEKSRLVPSESKNFNNGRHAFGGRRSSGAGSISRR